jgi:hypothetical protein
MSDKLPGISAYAYNLNSPIQYKDPDGRLPLPVIGAIVGGAGGFVYGAIKYGFSGDNWKKTMAATAGGAIAGATLGLGGAGIAAAGGTSALGAANSLYILGGSALAGGAAGNLTEQGVNMALGSQSGFNEGDFVMSLALSIPEALLGEALGNTVGGAVKSEMTKSLTKNMISTSRQENKFIKDAMKTIRESSGGQISRKDARIAATKALNIARETEQEVLNFTITVTERGVDVTNVGVSRIGGDAIRSTTENQ